MTGSEVHQDYWTQASVETSAAASTAPGFELRVDMVRGIRPMDRQFGIMARKTVPQPLLDPLFGQDDGRRDLQTYMILDAGRVKGLPEMLETSGLEHRCLFKGEAYDKLKDVAPWLVRLVIDNRFTRQIFTQSDATWHLWDKEPGIYLRSAGSLGEMWRHFRKFTKLPDETGKWYYWRFWEGGFLLPVLNAATPEDRQRFFLDGKIASIHLLTAGRHPELMTLKPPRGAGDGAGDA